MTRTVILVLVGCLALSGCGFSQLSRGTPLDPGFVGQIVPGESSMADVTALLGPPDEIIYSSREHDPLEERAFRYQREVRRLTVFFMVLFGTFRSDIKYDHVMVFFDADGKVELVAQRFDGHKSRYGLPTQDDVEEQEEADDDD